MRLVVSLGSVPMAVPHTRPVQLTNHATVRPPARAGERLARRDPGARERPVAARAAAGGVGSRRHGLRGAHPALRGAVRLPAGGRRAARRASRTSPGSSGTSTALEEAGEARQVEIATQIADSDDVRDVVTGLEQQYDAFHRTARRSNLLAEDEPLPSGEEIGAQFEQFLAGLDDKPDGGEQLVPASVEELVAAARPRGHRGQPVPRHASPTPRCSGSSAARSRRRLWWRRPAPCPSEYGVHSLHSYFLRPGDTRSRSCTTSTRSATAGRFATRRVVARQHGRPIFFHDRQLPDARGGARAPGRDARRARRRRTARP